MRTLETIRGATIEFVIVAVVALVGPEVHARGLTFEERVHAQEAIERVYYSHQIGASRPFEQVLTRAALEGKVRSYLKQAAALELYWKVPVTDEMLQRELERMSAGSRLPDRLLELYAALGNDPFLIKECLARPALVDRLSRGFFAFDETLHDDARKEAEAIRRRLAEGSLGPSWEHARREVIELVARDAPSTADFGRRRARWPASVGQVSPVEDARDAFLVRVVLEEMPNESLRGAIYRVPKMTWDEWWENVAVRLVDARIGPVAHDGGVAPRPVVRFESAASSIDGAHDKSGPLPDAEALSAPPCGRDNVWDNGILDDAVEPRDIHTAIWTGSLMVIWGGNGFAGKVNSGGRYDPATDTWTATATANAPDPRYGHSAIWTGSRMVVWGGLTAAGRSNSGGRYDPATDTWSPTSATNAPEGRENHTAVWTGSLMVVWGGYSATGRINSGGRYDPATDTWMPTSTTNAPAARSSHTATWTSSLMVVWGGSGVSGALNTGGRYNPATDSWTPTTTTNAPVARQSHTATWTGSLIVVWGGSGSGGVVNSGGRYHPSRVSWSPTSTANAPAARDQHTAIWTSSLIVVWGGNGSSGRINSGGRYDPATDTWTPTSSTNAPSGRTYHTAIWTGSLMVVWGGLDAALLYLDSGGRYDPVTDVWTPTSTNAPAARDQHTAIWTGSLMVIWGGHGAGFLDSGGRYDPATDTWSPTATTSAPAARYSHTATWTGSVMVVWGGQGSGGFLASGGRYDPVTDTWTPTSTTNAPLARRYHTAVWTGSLVVVWGGDSGSSTPNLLASGGRYDPVADAWTPTSITNAPAARRYHTAIWTGSLMVVWGGDNGSGVPNPLASGGRYNPTTDTWTPTNPLAPSARYSHTAVWSGGSMIVWGGQVNPSTYLDSGGRYDPAADAWHLTSTANAPVARSSHTAVWTGSLMVVWGGADTAGLPLASGGRYDPATDTWTPTSTTLVPSARHGHTAVWTGEFMVVWGGADSGDRMNGGRLVVSDFSDRDGDGISVCAGDCDDGDPTTYPGAPQLCDGKNNDCSDPSWPLAPPDEQDRDGDGLSFCAGDCNDLDPNIRPGTVEVCDGSDDDCDGRVDEGCDTTCDLPSRSGGDIDLGATNGTAPRLAWTGSGYGMAFVDVRDGNAEVYYAYLDASFNKLSGDIRISHAAGISNTPQIVWTGAYFGVVWQDDRDGNNEIYFSLLSVQGVNQSGEVRVTNAAGISRFPRIAWTGTDFGVLWNDQRDGSSFENYFVRLSLYGQPLGPETRITPRPYDSNSGQFAWNGSVYGIVYPDIRDGDWELYFQTIDRLGNAVTPETRLTSSTGYSRVPTIAWDSTLAQFGVAWVDNPAGSDQLFFTRVAANGTKLTGDHALATLQMVSVPPASIVHSGSEFALAWNDQTVGSNGVYFARVTASDALNGAPIRIGAYVASSQTPSLHWTGTDFTIGFANSVVGGYHAFATRIGCCSTTTIGDRAWYDTDHDGLQDAGETGAAGVLVARYDGAGNYLDSTVTGTDGRYSFTTASCGSTYSLRFFPPAAFFFSPRDQGTDDTLDTDVDPTTGSTGNFVLGDPLDATRWDAGIHSCWAPDEPVYIRSITRTTDGNGYPILNFQDPNQPGQITGYDIRRSSTAAPPPSSWPVIATDVVDMDAATPDKQWVDTSGDVSPTGMWFYQVTGYNRSCPAEGPF